MNAVSGGIMAYITLTKVKDHTVSPWLRAVSRDYEVPRNAQIFMGWGLNNERIAVWVGKDGSGFGAADQDPAGYVEFSRKLNHAIETGGDINFKSNHPGVDELIFDEPGTFDPSDETIELPVRSSLF
jgi:hypothetical protein